MPANSRADALTELVVWDLIQGDRMQAAKDASEIPNGATTSSVFIAKFAAMPSASANEWKERVEKIVPATMGPLRMLALGYALLLDGKREAAQSIWEQIVRQSPATDFLARTIDARLKGQKFYRALLPEPNNLNAFAGVLDIL